MTTAAFFYRGAEGHTKAILTVHVKKREWSVAFPAPYERYHEFWDLPYSSERVKNKTRSLLREHNAPKWAIAAI